MHAFGRAAKERIQKFRLWEHTVSGDEEALTQAGHRGIVLGRELSGAKSPKAES